MMNEWEVIVQLQIIKDSYEEQQKTDGEIFKEEIEALDKAIEKLKEVWNIPKDFPNKNDI